VCTLFPRFVQHNDFTDLFNIVQFLRKQWRDGDGSASMSSPAENHKVYCISDDSVLNLAMWYNWLRDSRFSWLRRLYQHSFLITFNRIHPSDLPTFRHETLPLDSLPGLLRKNRVD
jgi:hypothetical protein